MKGFLTGKRGQRLFTLLVGIAFLFSAGMMIRSQLQYQQIAQDSTEAAEVAGLTRQPTFHPAEPSQPEGPEEMEPLQGPLPEEAAFLAEIDLETLQAVNENVVGWIAIPGTELSYPLMQGTDNQYYLSHNWKKESAGGGSVFLESANNHSKRWVVQAVLSE